MVWFLLEFKVGRLLVMIGVLGVEVDVMLEVIMILFLDVF